VADSRSLETLTAEDFREIKGSRFHLTVELPGQGRHVVFQVELADVTQAARGPSGTLRTPFAVTFHGPIEPILPQGIYRLEHEQLGVLELFIVPIGPDEPSEPGKQPTAMRYEAVFA
jgi:hypothetical protein